MSYSVRGNTDWNCLPWPGKDSNNLHELSYDRDRTNKDWQATTNQKNTGKVKRRKETLVYMSYQHPRILLAGLHLVWVIACTTRRYPESEWLARDNPETNPITIKPETASHTAEQFSWVPLPCCSPPGCSFPITSLALSARVSPWTIHFWVLDKSPLSGPGRGPPSCNNSVHNFPFNTNSLWNQKVTSSV